MTIPLQRRRAFPLDQSVALVTGAARGLGAATARELAGRGAHVVVADRERLGAEQVAASLPRGRGHAVECDVTVPDSVRAAAEVAREQFGGLDVVVANAGVLGGGGTFRTLVPGQAEQVLDVNVHGVINTVTATIDDLVAHHGRLVLVSSVFAYMNGAGAIPYAMSKAAVEQLGRGLGVELAAHGVSVTTAYFSLIDTDLIRDGVDADPHRQALLSASPRFMLKRIAPDFAASAIVDGVEARARSVTVPARWRPVSALRGIAARLLDARYLRDPAIQGAIADLENHHLGNRVGAS